MLKEFINFNNQNKLWSQENKIAAAVSGGIDSVCMLNLLIESGIKPAIFHCNFKLRNEESDGDEEFVASLAEKYGLKFHSISFNTEEYADENNLSTQMAARQLRYEWFDELCMEYGYEKVAIAHNLDDIGETVILNLTRGTGLRGVTGIKPKTGSYIRPLLYASRDNIAEYIKKNGLKYREDSTNSKILYARNKVRHTVVPRLKEINESFNQTMLENIEHLKDAYEIYKQQIEQKKNEIIERRNQLIYIDINKLKELNPLRTYLYEFLNPYGFNKEQIVEIIESINSQSGKQFISSSHRLIRDRLFFILSPYAEHNFERFYVEPGLQYINKPLKLKITSFEKKQDFSISRNRNVALIDFDKIEFPLLIRKWKAGDYFMPLGMKNLKKLSDFFIDNKFSIYEKENQWILFSGDKIIWIIGNRLDDRFKITEETTRILQIEWICE